MKQNQPHVTVTCANATCMDESESESESDICGKLVVVGVL